MDGNRISTKYIEIARGLSEVTELLDWWLMYPNFCRNMAFLVRGLYKENYGCMAESLTEEQEAALLNR